MTEHLGLCSYMAKDLSDSARAAMEHLAWAVTVKSPEELAALLDGE